MKRPVLALAIVLAGCAGHAGKPAATHVGSKPSIARGLGVRAPPAPRGTHCARPSPPAYPDTDAALERAPGLAERVTLLRAGRELRDAYERRIAADGCSMKAGR